MINCKLQQDSGLARDFKRKSAFHCDHMKMYTLKGYVVSFCTDNIDIADYTDTIDITDCTEILSLKELERVLRDVDKPILKICRDMNIADHTCNTHNHNGNLRADVVAYEYKQQNPVMCWEKVIVHLCEDFDHVRLAYKLSERHNVLDTYSKHCT